MKLISKILAAFVLLFSLTANAQIKNIKTETVKINGNCDMCKSTIEKAGNVKNTASVNWNKDTKTAVLSYDSKKTSQDEILKRIALAGYDSEQFLAPDETYAKLPECCQYERAKKTDVPSVVKSENQKMEMHDHTKMTETKQEDSQLQAVFDNYFAVKDALVKSDSKTASAKSKDLVSAINSVKMEKLSVDEHNVWMKVMNGLTADSKNISAANDVKNQRESFKSLSKNVYALVKAAKPAEAVYYQYCPMQDANWLSRENSIKNPYYGSQMLTCGQTVETIK